MLQSGQTGGAGDGGSADQSSAGAAGGPTVLGWCGFPASQRILLRAASLCDLQDPDGHRRRDPDQQAQGQVLWLLHLSQ